MTVGDDSVLAAKRAKRRRVIALCMCVLIAIAAWAACVTSYFVEWSTYTKGPVRMRPAGAGAAPTSAATMPEERDETHYMLGHGRVMVLSHTPFTASFDAPMADLNSKYLAWAVADDFFPGVWRFDRYPPGPMIGVKLWPIAVVCTLPLLVFGVLCLRKRYPEGHCRRCGYDLRGLSGEKCPECGAAAIESKRAAKNQIDKELHVGDRAA